MCTLWLSQNYSRTTTIITPLVGQMFRLEETSVFLPSLPQWESTATSPLRSSDCGASFSVVRLPLEIQMQSCPFKIDRKKWLRQPDAPLPGDRQRCTARDALGKRKAKGNFLSCSPLVVCWFISPTYTSIWNLLPPLFGLDWVNEYHTSQSTSS